MFETFKALLTVFFFYDTVLLTPEPIHLSEAVEIQHPSSLQAITTGARIVLNLHNGTTNKNRLYLQSVYPKGCVSAEIVTNEGEVVMLEHAGFSTTKESIGITLYPSGGFPTDITFKKITIRPKMDIGKVSVQWINFSL